MDHERKQARERLIHRLINSPASIKHRKSDGNLDDVAEARPALSSVDDSASCKTIEAEGNVSMKSGEGLNHEFTTVEEGKIANKYMVEEELRHYTTAEEADIANEYKTEEESRVKGSGQMVAMPDILKEEVTQQRDTVDSVNVEEGVSNPSDEDDNGANDETKGEELSRDAKEGDSAKNTEGIDLATNQVDDGLNNGLEEAKNQNMTEVDIRNVKAEEFSNEDLSYPTDEEADSPMKNNTVDEGFGCSEGERSSETKVDDGRGSSVFTKPSPSGYEKRMNDPPQSEEVMATAYPTKQDNFMTRRRAQKKKYEDEEHNMPSVVQDKHKLKGRVTIGKRQQLSCGKFVLMALLLSCLTLYLRPHPNSEPTSPNVRQSHLVNPPQPSSPPSAKPVSGKNWAHCALPKGPTTNVKISKSDYKGEPLWLPVYPSSLPGVFTNFLNKLTGLYKSNRDYYKSSSRFTRCHYHDRSNDVPVTCQNIHPIVGFRPHPSAQSKDFGKVVLVALRNPMTAFPAHNQEKAERYGGVKGQVERSAWIASRDQYTEKLIGEWRNFIMEWRNMDPYTVAMYLPYEKWSDEKHGPALVKRLAAVLKNEELPVVYDFSDDSNSDNPTDLECLWYENIKEAMDEVDKKKIDDGWYTPEYTTEQLQSLATMLDTLAQEIRDGERKRPGDEELIDILHEYRKSIPIG